MKDSRTSGVVILILLGIIVFFVLDKCTGTQKELTSAKEKIKEHLISYTEAQVLKNQYIETRYAIINDSLFKGSERKDTREFWFSMETMELYLAYVKQEAKEKGYTDLGLRIYFAAYPKDFNDPRGDPGFSTVYIWPTIEENHPLQAGFISMPAPSPPRDADDIHGLNFGHGGP
ncbi:MAG: hypothetical protein QM485_07170 [Flavobacteriaceae bacterium]